MFLLTNFRLDTYKYAKIDACDISLFNGGITLNITDNKKQLFLSGLTILLVLFSVVFVKNNHFLYKHAIVEINQVTLNEREEIMDLPDIKDTLFHQTLVGTLKNGSQKGETVVLNNTYSSSRAFDHQYQLGDEVFITIDNDLKQPYEGRIDYPKRDSTLLLVVWLFIITVILIGKKSGLYSLLSLTLNIFVGLFILSAVPKKTSLLLLISGLVLFFTVTSLLLISGKNKKTYSAILATLLGTFAAFVIAFFVMAATSQKGLRYEEMAFATRNPQSVFLASLLIGSLGAAMDIAITITSSIYELYDKNNHIRKSDLKKSGVEIGRDIMGSMTNVIFFAYVSGSIPMLLLYLKNGSSIGFTFSMNLSLELARAAVGGIAIVLTIPISVYIATAFINRGREDK